ncbi:hypothetical protein SO802_022411 [Lithocarpus litseifolius]|uniref:RNase H type-1 domain-containing protein n=1 Tax=Lithocarpus litseifolius TaxID=425828 RepID=A0AAW2CMG4_9ROSI
MVGGVDRWSNDTPVTLPWRSVRRRRLQGTGMEEMGERNRGGLRPWPKWPRPRAGPVCNSKGKVMAAMSGKILKPPSVEILELLAAKRAVVFTVEIGFHQAVIEGDTKFV